MPVGGRVAGKIGYISNSASGESDFLLNKIS